MTARAIVLSLIAVVTFFAGVNVQAGWLFALADCLGGLLLTSLLVAIWSVRSIRLEYRVDSTIEQGVPARFAVSLTNMAFAGRHMLAVCAPPIGRFAIPRTYDERIRRAAIDVFRQLFVLVPHEWGLHFVETVPVAGTVHLDLEVPTPKRGVFPISPVYLQSAPLGLLFCRRRSLVNGEVVVTPNLIPLSDIPWCHPNDRGGDEHPLARTVPYGEMIRSTRDYRSGDPLRTIHWRGTARLGHLVVKETEGTSVAGAGVVLLDLAGHTDTGLEHAIQVTASLLAYLHGSGLPFHLVSQEGEVPGLLVQQLEALARVNAWPSDDEASGNQDPSGRPDPIVQSAAGLESTSLIVISPRDLCWSKFAPHWIQVGPGADGPIPGSIYCPEGSDVPAVLSMARPL